VVEGVGGQLLGTDAYDDEAREDHEHVEKHAAQLRAMGLEVDAVLGFGKVTSELIRLSKQYHVDVLMMGGHGHRGWKDILFGTSVTKVRHGLSIPVFVVQ
jgi:manganese transport protein